MASSILLGALAISAFEGAGEGIDRAIAQKLGDGGDGEDVFRDMQSCKLEAALAIIGRKALGRCFMKKRGKITVIIPCERRKRFKALHLIDMGINIMHEAIA